MRTPRKKWVDVYFYSHPVDQSIKYVGSERFGKEPLWLINNRRFKSWIGAYKVNINIIDTVNHDEADFWTEFYIDLFRQWGYELIKNDFLKESDSKRVRDLHKIKNLIVKNVYAVEYNEKPIQLQSFGDFYHEFSKLEQKSRDAFLTEMSLLLHCIFINGIPWEITIELTPDRIQKGYLMVGNTILTFSDRIADYSRLKCVSKDERIFQEISKACNKSHLKVFFTRYINAISIYFGYPNLTKGEFLKDFGRLRYWESGTAYSTTIFLIRLFRCKDRLELLVKLDLIPKLR